MIKPKEEVAETCDLEPIDRSTGDYLDLRLAFEVGGRGRVSNGTELLTLWSLNYLQAETVRIELSL